MSSGVSCVSVWCYKYAQRFQIRCRHEKWTDEESQQRNWNCWRGANGNTKTEKCNNIKNSLDVHNSRLNMKEQFEDLESRCIEMISSTRWGGRKQLRWNEQIPRGLLMNIISSKIIVIRVLEKKWKKKNKAETIFEEIVASNFWNLIKDIH